MKQRVFNNEGTFQANYAAKEWLDARGFSYGPSQACAPTAVWFGDCIISKWRNLSPQERRDAHATIEGDLREGPVRIILRDSAPEAAHVAFEAPDAPEQSDITGAKEKA